VHYQVLASFPGTTVLGDTRLARPAGEALVATDGTVYGLGAAYTVSGGGIYSVSPAGVFTDAHDLQITEGEMGSVNALVADGRYFPSLGIATDGSFYGVTYGGGPLVGGPNGPTPMGTVFRYASGQFSTLHTFNGSSAGDGATPLGVSMGSDGNYYGITEGDGQVKGVAFELTPSGQETVIYNFYGAAPKSFVLGTDGNIYGSLPAGWSMTLFPPVPIQSDALFKLTKDGTLTILYQFNTSTDGSSVHNLIQGSDGNFYGTAASGGRNGNGTVFQYTSAGVFTVLHAFDNTARQEGFSPGALTLATDGNLYGATEYGNNQGLGAVFRLSTSGVYSQLHNFDGTAAGGSTPLSIVQHGPRTFYGAAGASIYKMTVPVRDDFTGAGRASLLTSGTGVFQTGFISLAALSGVSSTNVAAGYYPAAVGDFNGDGVADIVWTSANNDLYVWFGKGGGGYTPAYMGSYPAGWAVVGAGDIDGDGIDDLLWVDQGTHQFAYWLMNGTVRKGYQIINIASGYYPAAIGDFDGDGKTDVMWTSANHDLYLWTSTDAGFKSSYITTYPANWKVVGRGDLDGDGKDDLVWMTNDGQSWGYWLMNGPSIGAVVPLSVPSAFLSGYRIVSVADYNGDGAVDVVWSNGQSLKLALNNGACSVTVACTFNMSVNSVPAPAGQTVFNSGVPIVSP